MTRLPILRASQKATAAVCASCRHGRGGLCYAASTTQVNPVSGRREIVGVYWCDKRNAAGDCPLYATTWWRRLGAWFDRTANKPVVVIYPDRDVTPDDSDVWPDTTSRYRASE